MTNLQKRLASALRALRDATNLRALRGIKHVPSMRAQQDAMLEANAALAEHDASASAQGDWQPIETAPLGPFLVWIPSTNMAWPAWKEINDRVFSNAHGPLNEMYAGRALVATHWRPKPAAPAAPTTAKG